MKQVVCIPSKGRPNTKTHQLFGAEKFDVIHFVEPQDFHDYNVVKKVNILEDNKGIANVRNFIIKYAKEQSFGSIIMCDDDINGFGVYDVKNKKNVTSTADCLIEPIEKAKKIGVSMCGFNYRQHAWHEKKQVSLNTKFVEVCVWVDVNKFTGCYRNEFNLKEDRDVVMQQIKNGCGVLRFNHVYFGCPDVGTNAGWLFDDYKQKKDLESCKNMLKEWNGYCSVVNKGGRVDLKYDLKKLAKDNNKQTL